MLGVYFNGIKVGEDKTNLIRDGIDTFEKECIEIDAQSPEKSHHRSVTQFLIEVNFPFGTAVSVLSHF